MNKYLVKWQERKKLVCLREHESQLSYMFRTPPRSPPPPPTSPKRESATGFLFCKKTGKRPKKVSRNTTPHLNPFRLGAKKRAEKVHPARDEIKTTVKSKGTCEELETAKYVHFVQCTESVYRIFFLFILIVFLPSIM